MLIETSWIDAKTGSWRTESRDSTGKIVTERVANGDKLLWTEDSSKALVEATVTPTQEAGLPVWLSDLHDLVAVPDKRVAISRVTLDGSSYWRLENDTAYPDLAPFNALIAVDSYQPKRITIGGQGESGNAESTWTVVDWRHIPLSSLAPDFFSFSQVIRLKPHGTPVQKN
jgi:hypothetical protein